MIEYKPYERQIIMLKLGRIWEANKRAVVKEWDIYEKKGSKITCGCTG
jgi:hypothetical protein